MLANAPASTLDEEGLTCLNTEIADVAHLYGLAIEVDMDKYLRGLERVMVPMARRKQSASPLTPKELHDYRSIVGQLAWPARQVMPQLAYRLSDL